MKKLFKAKTSEGFYWKILTELLQNNIQQEAYFQVTRESINLCSMDSNKTVLIDLHLYSDNFSIYRLRSDKPIYIGINLAHFYKMVRHVKKQDSIELFIDSKNVTQLGIKIIPKEASRVTTSFVRIQTTQNFDIELPKGYHQPIIIPSAEFQKLCKSLQISNTTEIYSKGLLIRFMNNAGADMLIRHTEFGEVDDSDSDTDESDCKDEYLEEFESDHLMKLSKLSGLGSVIHIYTCKDLPLYLRSSIGNLGTISIYIKSKNLLDV